MNDEQVHKCVPARRFPEFKNDGEWEKSIFSDVFEFLPNNTLSRADLNYDKGVVKNIHYGDVLIKFGETLDVNESSLPFISDEKNAQKASQGALKNGDVVIADTAEDEVVGKCTELKNVTNEIVVSGLHTIPVRPNVPFASSFLGFYLNSESYRKLLKPLMQGIKVIAISKGALSTTKIVYPQNFEEQKKIADCLSSVNDLILASKNKLELLKKQKNGLMQKLFPVNGKTVPEIRFKEFEKDGEWKEKLVKEICSIGTGKSNTQDQDKNGCFPFFIRSEYPVKSNKYLYDCEAVITIGDGKIGQVFHYVNGKFDLHQRCYRMFNFKNVLGKYFYYYFSMRFFERTKKMSAKATVDSVRLEMIADMPFLLPSLDEQHKIVGCLTIFESLVDQYARRLFLLEQYKKGLMQQLFPLSR